MDNFAPPHPIGALAPTGIPLYQQVKQAVLTALAKKRPEEESGERNMWGRPEDRLQRTTLYNPNAFRNVTFY